MDKEAKSSPPPLLEEWAWNSCKEWGWDPRLTKNQIEICRDYSFGRLAICLERIHRKQHNLPRFNPEHWLEDRTRSLRRAWAIGEFTAEVRGSPLWFTCPATRVMVLYPEWPDIPYLKIDPTERLRRSEAFALSKEDHLAQLAWLLEPLNSSTGKKCVRDFALPENLTHEQLLEAFAAWLKINVPGQGKPYRKSPGRGTGPAAVIDDLNAIAVYWLRKIAKLRRSEIVPLIVHPLTGAQVYKDEKRLDAPLARIIQEGRLQKFAEQAFGNLTPPEPL